jgi:hypothetical protein
MMTTIAIPPFKNNETLYFFDRRIMQYLQTKSRDDIARDCGLGVGTISNITAG